MKSVIRLFKCGLLLAAVIAGNAPAQAAPERFATQRPDGSTIHWSLDLPASQNGKAGLIVIMQGSGCEPVAQNRYLALTRRSFSDFSALTVNKYGVDPDHVVENESDYFENCPQEFYARNTNSQRVADYQQILEDLSGAKWWDGRLIIIGGSEGGDIAARVSVLIKPDATVLISTGGGTTFGKMVRESILGEMARNSVPRDQWPDIDGTFARARENPDSAKVEYGSSYKYWADSIDNRTVDDMLKIAAPILLIHGTNDTSSPLSTARIAVDDFTKAKRCNLTYWEKTGYSHGMVDPDGNERMEEILVQVNSWVQAQFKHSADGPCMSPNSDPVPAP